jgi:hypothetical protein
MVGKKAFSTVAVKGGRRKNGRLDCRPNFNLRYIESGRLEEVSPNEVVEAIQNLRSTLEFVTSRSSGKRS